jgi:phosphoglycerate dehydrogenase-like enzyme
MAKIGIIVHVSLRKLLFSDADQARLEKLGDVKWTQSDVPLTSEQAAELLRDADIAIGSWKSPVPDEQLLAACPKLQLWEHAAGSVKMMFGPQLRGRNLIIASCAPALAEQVAEFTLGLLMVGLKRVWPNAMLNRVGVTPKPTDASSLAYSTVGIIGASQAGRRVIDRLQPSGARILLYDPLVDAAEADALGVRKVEDLLDLCRSSNAISLHAPLLATTRKMLGAAHFQSMRDNAIFINTARGGCVDEAALIVELQRGRLFAFLDVTDPEPASIDSALRRLPNVVLTSHIAGMADFAIGRQAVDDVEGFLKGGRPKFVVTEQMLDRIA